MQSVYSLTPTDWAESWQELDIGWRIESIQTTVLLRSAIILSSGGLRRVIITQFPVKDKKWNNRHSNFPKILGEKKLINWRSNRESRPFHTTALLKINLLSRRVRSLISYPDPIPNGQVLPYPLWSGMVIPVRVCISHKPNPLGKYINPFIHTTSNYGLMMEKAGFFNPGMATSLGKGKLNLNWLFSA